MIVAQIARQRSCVLLGCLGVFEDGADVVEHDASGDNVKVKAGHGKSSLRRE
ncbi:hypothetical protein [Rhodopseudomonas sp. RCAM05734]|uniref:hypothetical protein n=1 Tax=Rhodopseudomonas sp. RCAM05734 TaxID=3457549 RepID=UPI004044FAA1